MRKLLLFICAIMLTASSFAQLPNGSIGPDFTMTDLDGVEHNLYSYLDDGYTVIIDFSAIWCGPCWSYHESGALENLYIEHGPAGYPNVSATTTDDVMVFFIEGDEGTIAQLNGGSGSQGNWVEGTPYPIIATVAPNNNQVTSDYSIGYWPTIYMICPDRLTNENGQITTAAHYALAQDCPEPSTTAYDAKLFSIINPIGTSCFSKVTPEIKIQNYGTENLTSLEIVSYIDDVENSTFSWTGELAQYHVETVTLPEMTDISNGDHVYKVVASNPSGHPDEDDTNNTLMEDFTINSDGKEVVLTLLTDNYPTETSWEMFLNDDVVAAGSGYSLAQNNYVIPICLEAEQCYTFKIYDEYGDGMSYGGVTGNVELTWGGTVMGQIAGDEFTTEGSFDFCIMGVGINNLARKDINVYPNPTTGVLNINGIDEADIAIYNITGSLIGNYNGNETIDLSSQPNGVYIIKVHNNDFITTKRITLNH